MWLRDLANTVRAGEPHYYTHGTHTDTTAHKACAACSASNLGMRPKASCFFVFPKGAIIAVHGTPHISFFLSHDALPRTTTTTLALANSFHTRHNFQGLRGWRVVVVVRLQRGGRGVVGWLWEARPASSPSLITSNVALSLLLLLPFLRALSRAWSPGVWTRRGVYPYCRSRTRPPIVMMVALASCCVGEGW